ncbi:hypothetical protein [Novosphingobium soli]
MAMGIRSMITRGMPIPLARTLPYTLHTNRELGLMLARRKPLAVFVDGKGHFPASVERYLRLFCRHVADGRFIRRDHFSPPIEGRNYPLHHIYFALPGEQWRIDEMIELKSSLCWSRDHERREGELLGYEDWMNDHFLDRFYPKPTV